MKRNIIILQLLLLLLTGCHNSDVQYVDFTDLDMAENATFRVTAQKTTDLSELTNLENQIDETKKELTASHFSRLVEGNCSMEVSPYYSSTVVGLERVADHLVNVGYSIVNPVGSQKEM